MLGLRKPPAKDYQAAEPQAELVRRRRSGKDRTSHAATTFSTVSGEHDLFTASPNGASSSSSASPSSWPTDWVEKGVREREGLR
jgi:hypothetical protein